MMKQWARILLLLYMPVLFLISCRKDPNATGGSGTNYGVMPIPQNLMDYSYFKPGTWWVYVDSISGQRDSLYVSSASQGYDTIKESAGYGYTGIFGWFNLRYYNSYGYYYEQYCHASYGIVSGKTPVFLHKNGIQYSSPEGTLLFSQFAPGVGAAYGHGDGQNSEAIYCQGTADSIIIAGTIFYNTVCFYNTWQPAERYNKTTTCLAKKIGVVKKHLLDSNQNWQLIKYNIVQ